MRHLIASVLCATALTPAFAIAAEADADADQRAIVVTAAKEAATVDFR